MNTWSVGKRYYDCITECYVHGSPWGSMDLDWKYSNTISNDASSMYFDLQRCENISNQQRRRCCV